MLKYFVGKFFNVFNLLRFLSISNFKQSVKNNPGIT